jgi:hypothetical protein
MRGQKGGTTLTDNSRDESSHACFKKGAAMLKGGCFCGWIRYEAAGTPFHETNCHCSICRKTSGAPFVTWFSVPRSEFRLVCGEPVRFKSSPEARRSFCPRCGTPLTFEHQDFPDEIDVTTCSLDHPKLVPPKDHTWTSSKVGWLKLAGLPEYRESRPEE